MRTQCRIRSVAAVAVALKHDPALLNEVTIRQAQQLSQTFQFACMETSQHLHIGIRRGHPNLGPLDALLYSQRLLL